MSEFLTPSAHLQILVAYGDVGKSCGGRIGGGRIALSQIDEVVCGHIPLMAFFGSIERQPDGLSLSRDPSAAEGSQQNSAWQNQSLMNAMIDALESRCDSIVPRTSADMADALPPALARA